MTHPPVVIVDEHDTVIGSDNLANVWKKGLYHRIVHIMVEDKQGRILLQKRASAMELYPDCWDHSASGHVDEGETYDQAAARELNEEVGLEGLPLKAIASYQTEDTYQGRILNRFNRVYRVRLPKDILIHLELKEVSETRWFTLDDARRLIKDHPEQVTDGLLRVIKDYY